MRRRPIIVLGIALAAAGIALVGLLYTGWFRSWLGGELSARATQALGRQVEVRVARWRPHALELGLSDLRIAGEESPEAPLLVARRVHAAASWGALLRGRLELARLHVSGAHLDLSSLVEGPAGEEPEPVAELVLGPFPIAELEIVDSSVRWAGIDAPVAVSAGGLELGARWRPDPAGYRGSVRADAASVEWPAIGSLPISAGFGFELSAAALVLDGGTVSAPGLELAGGGAYRPGSPAPLEADLTWRANLADLPIPWLAQAEGRGTAAGTAWVRSPGAATTAGLRLEAPELWLGSVPIEEATARLDWNGQQLRLDELTARVAGIDLRGSGAMDLSDSAVDAALDFAGQEIGPLLRLAGIEEARIEGALAGRLTVAGAASSWEALRGGLEVEVTELRALSRPARRFRMAARGGLEEGVIEAASVELTGPGLELRGGGHWRPSESMAARGRVSFSGWGDAAGLIGELGVLAPADAALLGEIAGTVAADFELAAPLQDGFDSRQTRGSFELRSEGLAWNGRPGYRLSGRGSLRLDQGKPFLVSARLKAPGLSAAIRGPGAAAGPYRVEVEAADIGPTAGAIATFAGRRDVDAAGSSPESWAAIAGRLRGAASLGATVSSWQPGLPLGEVAGSIELTASEVGLGGLGEGGLRAELSSTFAGPRLDIGRLSATLAGLEIGVKGELDRQRAHQLEVRLSAPSLAASLEQARLLLPDLGVDAGFLDRLAGLSGGVVAEALVSGPWRWPQATGGLEIVGLGAVGRELGDLVAEAESDGERLRYSARLGPPGQRVVCDGELELAGERRATLRGRVDRQPLAPLAQLAGLGDRLSGEIEGEVEFAWPGGRNSGRLLLSAATVAGVAVERLDAEWHGDLEALEITRGELRGAGGAVELSGRLGPGGGQVDLSGEGLQFANLVAAAGLPVDVEGSLGFRGRILGTPEAPRLEARITTRGTRLLQRPAPDLSGPIQLDSSGLAIALASDDGTASLSWNMGFTGDEPWSGALEYPIRLALDPWLSGDTAARESVLEGVVRGDLRMPGGQPENAVGRLGFDNARLTAAGYSLRLVDELRVDLEPEVARLLPLRLRGEGTELTITAEVTRDPAPRLHLEAVGELDLRVLQAFDPLLTSGGTARLDLQAGGPWPDFTWQGRMTVRDGAVRHAEFPASLDRLAAKVSLGAREWTLDEFRGRLGGGLVSATGRLEMAGSEPGDLELAIEGAGVQLDYPEGFRSRFDATLELSRPRGGGFLLAGELALAQGLYSTDIGVERSILARTRALETAAEVERDWTDELALDLRLRAPEGLWVRNDLASLESRGELRVEGTLGRPRVSGRVEALEGGRIFFREVSYYVTQGAFDWLGGPVDDPRVSVQAETSVGEYDVTLTVSGRLSEPVFELASRPSLPTTDIVALLVTGATRDQLAASEGGLSQAQAAAYLSSGLTSRLEASLRRSLGLDEVKLDPVLVEGQTNPTARVTVGKAISPRLSATYSTRLGSAQKDVYQARFRLAESFELVGTRDDDGSLAADLRHNARRRRAAPAGEGGASRAVIRQIEIHGGAVAGNERLRRLLDLRIGEELRRARVLDGLDRVRGWYLERRYPETDATYRVIEVEGGVKLEVEVDEGPQVRLRFVGFEAGERLERHLLELWQRSLFRDEIMRDLAARAADFLAREGYVEARAEGALGSQEPDRVEAAVTITPGPRVRVKELKIVGSGSLEERRVREQILTRRSSLRPRWLDPSLLAEDAEAIRALYVSSGFLAATVRPRVDRPPPGDRASVTWIIEEGPRFSLRSVRFVGNRAVPIDDLRALAKLSAGEPYQDDATRDLQRSAEALYDERGFPDARVEVVAAPEVAERVVDLVVSIHEGEQRRVEAVEIVNPGITRESVVRREIELSEGGPLRRSALESSQYRLYRTGLFRSVRLERLPGETAGGERLRVALEEARNLRVSYGVGFDSEEGPRVTANVAHNNLDGGRLHLGVGGRWSPVDQRVQLLLRNPSMGGARAVGLMSAFWESEERENFNATRTGLSLDLGQRYREGRFSANLGYDLTELDEEQTAAPGATLPGGGTTRLAGARLGVARTTRDSSFWPTTGSHTRAEATLFHSVLGSEAEFGRLFGQWNRYRTLRGGAVWSFGFRAGVAQSLGSSAEIPFSERFFAGGETSLRGFARDSVIARGTPPELSASLLPGQSLGGDAQLVINQEVMARLWESVYGVVFYDAGNLYWRPGDFDPADLRHSMGLGIRVQSPFGPVRLEYGWKLDRRAAESAGQGHFSLGLAF